MAWIEVFRYFSPGTCKVNIDNLPLEQGKPLYCDGFPKTNTLT